MRGMERCCKRPRSRGAPRPRRVIVGLWMSGALGQDIIDGIHDWLRESGADWRVRFADSGSLFASSLSWMLREGVLDGVVSFYHEPTLLDALRRAGIPIVLLGERPVDSPPASPLPPLMARVELDLAAVAGAAAEHLLSRTGFRSAGYVESHFDHGWSRHRGDAVEREFRRRGFRFSRFLHYGAPSPRDAENGPDFDGLARWLRALEKPAAVVAGNDATGVDVIHVCDAAGIAVPRDVAVLGMDDNPVHCLHCQPPLSSVHFDGRCAGALCAAALSGMMEPHGASGPARGATLRYDVSAIVQRASTGAVSTAGALVQKALDFIDANACSGISLADVVRHLGVSRSLATQRFGELHGTSILDTIHARRVAEAKRLLRSSGKPLDDIASACGFRGGPDCLRRVFRAATGMTPAQWRDRTR